MGISDVGFSVFVDPPSGWNHFILKYSYKIWIMYIRICLEYILKMFWRIINHIPFQVFLPPSRRLANWTYFNWMIAYNLTLMLFFLICDLLLNYLVYMRQNRTNLNGVTYTKDTPVSQDAGSFSGTRYSTSRKRTKHMTGHAEETLNTTQPVEETEQPIPNITLNSQRNKDYGAFLHVPVLYSQLIAIL